MTDTAALTFLRSPISIRSQCQQIFKLACQDGLKHFAYEPSQLATAVAYVVEDIQANYGDGKIPFHSRFRHFEAGGVDRLAHLLKSWHGQSAEQKGRRLFELVFVSVLLDAGAGPFWSYQEGPYRKESKQGPRLERSEGLAVASFHMFVNGAFSSDKNDPERVDAKGLLALSIESLAASMQVSASNPLVGLEGRLQLLHGLGRVLQNHAITSHSEPKRLGAVFDLLWAEADGKSLELSSIFSCLLENFSSIWPGGTLWQGMNIGDVGRHPQVSAPEQGCSGLIPFHKLSQWLSYSLLEAFALVGCPVTGLDDLTGLPEYRNGGLLLDLGVLRAKDPAFYTVPQRPQSEAVVELRALTVAILDLLAKEIRHSLKKSADELPLVAILQGGTWSAGRKIAKSKRSDGSPPFSLDSDGTVF